MRLTFLLILMSVLLVGCGTRRGPMAVDEDAPTEFETTESGLKYRILRKADGPKPKPSDTVEVDYSGWLDNGAIFDSSYDRRQSTSFNLGSVVAGWTEGLQYVSEGGMIELEIPPNLGYGPQAKPGIPANSTLHFKVELHDIK